MLAVSMAKCVVSCCPNVQDQDQKRFFRIPQDPARIKVWLAALREPHTQQWTEEHMICEEHFLPEDLSPSGVSPDAIPIMPPCLEEEMGMGEWAEEEQEEDWGAGEAEEQEEDWGTGEAEEQEQGWDAGETEEEAMEEVEDEAAHVEIQEEEVTMTEDTHTKSKQEAVKRLTPEEACVLTLDSSSEDSEFDANEEEMFEDGMDPLLDRNCVDSGDEWEPPALVTPVPAPAEDAPTALRRGRRRSREAKRVPLPHGSSERWNNVDELDIVPRQFPFRPAREPGPQPRSMLGHGTVMDFFRLFFTDTVVASLLENMNAFGSHQNENWVAVTMTDFYSFLAVVIYTGIVKLPEMAFYWRQHSSYDLPFPSAAMSRNTFMRMCRSLHLCSMEDDARNQALRGTPHYDRLAKVRPLYELMVTACRDNYHPNINISIGERMVASKARIALKQYVKNKPTKWGYKLFVLADSDTGYTWNCFMYEGKASLSGKGLSYDSVMSLLNMDGLGSGYHLYVDDFYTSPHLFRDLFARHIGACGAIKTNRIGFPRTSSNNLSRVDPRGSVRWIRENELLFVKRKGTREQVFCSTLHTMFSGDAAQRPRSLLYVPLPAAIKDYRSHMGGVDLSDALIGYFTVLHRTSKWYRTLFFHFLDIAIVNASVLYNATHADRKLSQLQFREELISQLYQYESPSTAAKRAQTQSSASAHIPLFFNQGKDIDRATAATVGRRRCKLCHKRTPLGCELCAVPLCLIPTRNCYQQWHQSRGLL